MLVLPAGNTKTGQHVLAQGAMMQTMICLAMVAARVSRSYIKLSKANHDNNYQLNDQAQQSDQTEHAAAKM